MKGIRAGERGQEEEGSEGRLRSGGNVKDEEGLGINRYSLKLRRIKHFQIHAYSLSSRKLIVSVTCDALFTLAWQEN